MEKLKLQLKLINLSLHKVYECAYCHKKFEKENRVNIKGMITNSDCSILCYMCNSCLYQLYLELGNIFEITPLPRSQTSHHFDDTYIFIRKDEYINYINNKGN